MKGYRHRLQQILDEVSLQGVLSSDPLALLQSKREHQWCLDQKQKTDDLPPRMNSSIICWKHDQFKIKRDIHLKHVKEDVEFDDRLTLNKMVHHISVNVKH